MFSLTAGLVDYWLRSNRPPLGDTATGERKRGHPMLILRRRIGERIVIDGRIEVTVLHVRGGKVRLGFSAPRNVRVLREEVLRPSASESRPDPTATAVEVEASVT
jgi:carbon storage regulator